MRKLIQRFVASGGFIAIAWATTAWGEAERHTKIDYASIDWKDNQATAKDRNGRRVNLGLNRGLQHRLNWLLQRARPIAGAATLVDAQTGQVLAAGEIGATEGSLLFDPIAPAASVFKIATTAALFEHTDVTPMTRVCTKGGNRSIRREHLKAPLGAAATCGPFAHALGVSRNAAYAQLATQKLMREQLIATSGRLGFGSELLLDVKGTLGTLEVPYNDLSFARTAVGFENSHLSVFGGAQLALTIASGGLTQKMHFQSAQGVQSLPERVLSTRTVRRLRDAMEITIHSGTARSSFVSDSGKSTVGPIQVAGKTGTLKPHRNGPTASWFIGFAPSENPRVVVSVLLQNPDKWHQKGHQVGRDLLVAYLTTIGVRGLVTSR